MKSVFTVFALCGAIWSTIEVLAFSFNFDLIKSRNERYLLDHQSVFDETMIKRTKRHLDEEEYDLFGKEIMGNEEGSEEEFVHIYNHDIDQYDTNQNQFTNEETLSEYENDSQYPDENEITLQQNVDTGKNQQKQTDTGGIESDGQEVSKSGTKPPIDIHGGIKMGVKNQDCDDGKIDLELDWDNRTDWEYTCTDKESLLTFSADERNSIVDCLPPDEVPKAIHTCMKDQIEYEDIPPRGGRHRPLWAMFGEYLYCPPERWVHNLEHGSAVFLYHPCADAQQIQKLKTLARSCLRKHIITPYRPLGTQQPFAVVTWGCKWQGNHIDENEIVDFVREHAQQASESGVERDGQYMWGLVHKAQVVSDINDSVLCPVIYYDAEHMVRDVTDETTQIDDVIYDDLTLPPM